MPQSIKWAAAFFPISNFSMLCTPLTAGITKLDVKCFAGSDGSANLTVNRGTTLYSFAWSNLALTEDISRVIFGKYIVTITDKNVCQIKIKLQSISLQHLYQVL